MAAAKAAQAPPPVASDPTMALCQEIAARLAAVAADGAPDVATPLEAVGRGRLAELAERFALGPIATGLIAVAATSMLDGRFGSLFAGFDAGRSRPRPRVDVAMTVAGGSLLEASHRELLGPASVLRRAGLLEVHDEHDPLPDRVLAVPERVVGFVLGSDAADPALLALLAPAAGIEHPAVLDVTRALLSGRWLVWLRDHGGSGRSAAATALGVVGTPAVVLDLDRLPAGQTLGDVLPSATCEAGLAGGAVVIGPIDPRRDREALRQLSTDPIRPLVLVSPAPWDPSVSAATPVLVDAPRLDPIVRRPIWNDVLAELDVADAGDVATELALLRIPPDRASAVGATAAGLAAAAGEDVDVRHLRAAALAQGAGRLDALSQHVVPLTSFDDLVLPPDVMAELRAVPGRYRTRHVVREQWGLDRRDRRGITCLFAGASGTGKTLAAEVIAHELGVDLFVIDLSQIVDKYIGETEKNLDRVFNEAEGVNGVLLFDEADALFGKRSAVSSAHDRHANVEVAYLLQRMERYEGVAVLTTNLRNNIDEAFTRRLDVICSFPEPGAEERLALWQRHLPASVPQDADVDLRLLADGLPVAGGTIRNIALTAAHSAAIAGGAVTQAMLVAAARREYLKLGRMYTELRPDRVR